MPDQAPNIESFKDKGRLVYDKERRTIVSQDTEVARIMALSEDELRAELEAEGDTLEAVADRSRAAFERAKIEADARLAIQVWLKCPRETRPSAQALGVRIAEIASTYPR